MPYSATLRSSSASTSGMPNMVGVGTTSTTRMSSSTPMARQWSHARYMGFCAAPEQVPGPSGCVKTTVPERTSRSTCEALRA